MTTFLSLSHWDSLDGDTPREGITAQNEKANRAAHTKDISFFMMKLRRIMSQCKMPVEGKIAYECKARMGFL